MFAQAVLDLAQFDAEPAQLDLAVATADELDPAVVQPAAVVAGAVDALAGAPGVVQELLRGQLGPVDVALGHAGAADPDFAEQARRAQLAGRIDDVHRGVRHRPADRQ
ncbi:hypothetical protein, partial [Lysobacter sp. yr284]|uniref:hypothetical protein n=1 Tax=Lysobacter sp. yr284 TaxID=1761791 RepID=UPI0020C8B611